jgi:hypothetical protein
MQECVFPLPCPDCGEGGAAKAEEEAILNSRFLIIDEPIGPMPLTYALTRSWHFPARTGATHQMQRSGSRDEYSVQYCHSQFELGRE